ncbi:hypothetical protein F511_21354 [Dorcoceras hygrometricum]|uniref:Uncharacterized protein n=1 Tax=Dorcoceras hygrometricum TaxID=472368 RepID=A0A2Z7BKD1_9LAMI|nr:hypothetical protein F511_21354 [Dorcoceras hygrometricum]
MHEGQIWTPRSYSNLKITNHSTQTANQTDSSCASHSLAREHGYLNRSTHSQIAKPSSRSSSAIPSSDLLPTPNGYKNVGLKKRFQIEAQISKISKSTKIGPISNIGPKTSWAAQDRPEQYLEENQPSHHCREHAGRRPPPHSARHKAARCRAKSGACSAQPPCEQRPYGAQPVRFPSPSSAQNSSNRSAISRPPRATSGKDVAHQCAKSWQSAGHKEADNRGHARRRRGRFLQNFFFVVFDLKIEIRYNMALDVLKDSSLCSDTTVEKRWRIRIPLPGAQRKTKSAPESAPGSNQIYKKTGSSRYAAVDRQSGPRPESIFLRQSALEDLKDFAWTETPLHDGWNKSGEGRRVVADGRRVVAESTCVTLNGSGIQLAVGPQPLRLRNHDFGLAQRIMVKRLATSRHDPLGITDSACKNQLVVVSVQYGPFNTYIPIRSTTIGKSRVARDPIAMHTSWRSNSDIASVTRTNQYNQDLGLIHSTNGNHLESPNEGSSIDHQVTIHLHAHNITMFPTNENMVLRIADASLKLGRPYPHFDGPID